jgi:cell volume regulation protein A
MTNNFGGSGFLAVYLMGYIVGNARLPQIIHILRMHDGLAWISQISMFLMLGLLVAPSNLMEHFLDALLLAAILIFVARPLAVFISLIPFHFPFKDQVFISWVGLRGAVPIILALFPWLAGVPNEHLYFDVAFVVVIVSLMLQGWSLVPVARWLKLEVPAELQPDQAMPLDAIPSKDVMEVLAFNVKEQSPIRGVCWPDLKFTVPIQFLGVIRDGEWLLPLHDPVFNSNDTLMVLAKITDVKKISEVLASEAETSGLSNSNFFGDFVLNGAISLADLDAFYTINLTDQNKQQSLSSYITERFHRRVVIGDQVRLDQLLLTVRELDEQGVITQVGIKAVDVQS